MKIILLGGGTGGHFYPVIAVARALRNVQEKKHIIDMKLIFMNDNPINEEMLREEEIIFERVTSGKWRRYSSFKNFFDLFKTLRGIVSALWKFAFDPPDIVFSKGGFASFPTLIASKIYRIPVLIHESDIIPGKVNLW